MFKYEADGNQLIQNTGNVIKYIKNVIEVLYSSLLPLWATGSAVDTPGNCDNPVFSDTARYTVNAAVNGRKVMIPCQEASRVRLRKELVK
jgi:hypothetical protein